MKSYTHCLLISGLLVLSQCSLADDRCDEYPIDHGKILSCWAPRDNVCNGQGEHYNQTPTYESQYEFNLCKEVEDEGRGCYVLFASDLFWFCRGSPECDKSWNPSTYCKRVQRTQCDDGYDYIDGQCKFVPRCDDGHKVGEMWGHNINHGKKHFMCASDLKVHSWITCEPGYQNDGFGCYKYIP